MERCLNILLVDDEEIIHQTIGSYLTDSGHDVKGAYEGQAALRLIDEQDYDVAIIDMRMPGMDGLSLLAELKKICPDLPVIIIAGHGDIEAANQALELGASKFLRKPVGLLDLEVVLEDICSD